MHFRKEDDDSTKLSKNLFSAAMLTLRLKEHNKSTWKNETQGILCKVDGIIKKTKTF